MRKILMTTTAVLLSATLAACDAPEEAATDGAETTEEAAPIEEVAPVEESTDAMSQETDTDAAPEDDEADGDRGNPIDE